MYKYIYIYTDIYILIYIYTDIYIYIFTDIYIECTHMILSPAPPRTLLPGWLSWPPRRHCFAACRSAGYRRAADDPTAAGGQRWGRRPERCSVAMALGRGTPSWMAMVGLWSVPQVMDGLFHGKSSNGWVGGTPIFWGNHWNHSRDSKQSVAPWRLSLGKSWK